MKWKCNFSYKHYFEVLDYAKKNYSIGKINQYSKIRKKDRFILLKHDVDLSLDHALKMAQLEKKHEIESTYFVLLHSQFYNALSQSSLEIIKKISRLGHEIGLHYDTAFLPRSTVKAALQLKQEAQILENITGKKIVSTAQHNVSIADRRNFLLLTKGFIDVRSDKLIQLGTYISDSAKNWRTGCMCKHVGKVEKLLILTHPIWWNSTHLNRNRSIIHFKDDELKKFYYQINTMKNIQQSYLNELKN